jgi:hypothetical protein
VARLPLPIQEAIRDLIGDLLGRGTAVDKSDDPVAPGARVAVGGFRDGAGRLLAVLPMDRDLVCILGGALVMVPEVAVKEIMRIGDIPENLYENLWEVANIMASLLNREGGMHVVLTDRWEGDEPDDADAQALLAAPVRQRWFSLTVDGYGSGRLGFLTAD